MLLVRLTGKSSGPYQDQSYVLILPVIDFYFSRDVKMEKREIGTVKWFNNAKGFGFIVLDDQEDVFVHFRSIRGDGYRTLKQGANVEFNLVTGQKGLQAEDVVSVSEAH